MVLATRFDDTGDWTVEQQFVLQMGSSYLLAHGIFLHLGAAYNISEKRLLKVIENKPTRPDDNSYYMDHAFFSAVRLYRELVSIPDGDKLSRATVDALTAIMLHNSLYKFAVADYKNKDLAWLLMLCDELQCWDRTAYGRNSRTELHPMAADFHFSGNAIHSVYHYDLEEVQKIHDFWEEYFAWEEKNDGSKPPRLKDYSDTAAKEQRFRRDIESIVDLTGFPLFVDSDLRTMDRKVKHTYLSSSSFLHIYDFAVALNARYNYQGKEEDVPARGFRRPEGLHPGNDFCLCPHGARPLGAGSSAGRLAAGKRI